MPAPKNAHKNDNPRANRQPPTRGAGSDKQAAEARLAGIDHIPTRRELGVGPKGRHFDKPERPAQG